MTAVAGEADAVGFDAFGNMNLDTRTAAGVTRRTRTWSAALSAQAGSRLCSITAMRAKPTRSVLRFGHSRSRLPGHCLIGQRTREALAAKKASGVRLGRPPTVPQTVVCRIQRLRARGLSLRAIADELNESKVATAQGGKQWYAATVRGVLARSS
jgi:Recombinase